MRYAIALAAASLFAAVPSAAAVYQFDLTGTITSTEGDAPGNDIVPGAVIAGRFTYDDNTRSTPNVLALGGGTYTIYSTLFTNLQLNVGSYSLNYASFSGSITYMDDTFGQDGIVFLFGGLPGGPFGSIFANFQLQARGPTNAIDGSGAANGLPLNRFDTSFFGGFGNENTSKRLFGTLAITPVNSVPEPITWVMMLIGFGAVGFALRRRQNIASRIRSA